jgi:nucleoside-diphosphate-sugar epimerase
VVTGAQGLLGRHVVAELVRAGAPAVIGVGRSRRRDDTFTHAVTRRGTPVPAPVPDELQQAAADPRYTYRSLDIADAAAVTSLFRAHRPVAVVHAAGMLRDSTWTELLESNVRGTLGTAVAAADAGARLVFVSSGSVYGAGGGALPLREDGVVEPAEPYGVTKRAAEDVARVVGRSSGCTVTSARVFNLLGPGLQERHLPALVASRLADALDGGRVRLRLGPLDATRDFIDVRDAARAVVFLATAEQVPPVVNVASGRETPVREVLDVLTRLAGAPTVSVEELPRRGHDIPRAVADVSLQEGLGLRASTPLDDSLSTILTYYLGIPAGR